MRSPARQKKLAAEVWLTFPGFIGRDWSALEGQIGHYNSTQQPTQARTGNTTTRALGQAV